MGGNGTSTTEHRATRSPAILGTTLALVMALPTLASADPGKRCSRRAASVTDDGGRTVWCAASNRDKLMTPPIWSASRHAVAFAVKRRARHKLVVVLVGGDADLHTMSWKFPARSRALRKLALKISWLGHRRVALGKSLLRPSLIASWKVNDGKARLAHQR